MIDLAAPRDDELSAILHQHEGNTCAERAAADGIVAARLIGSPHADMLLSLVGLAEAAPHVVDQKAEIRWWYLDFAMPGAADPRVIARWMQAALAGCPDKPPFPLAAAVLWIGGRRYGARWTDGQPWTPNAPSMPVSVAEAGPNE